MRWITYKNAVVATCLFFSLAFSLLSLLRYQHFMMGSYDLAIFDQAIWHYGRFEPPISTVRNMNILGDHFSPALILLSPFRLLWPDARILLILQAVIVSFSVYFIFQVLEKKLQNSLAAYSLSLTFYLFLGLQYALDYDFHLVSLSVLPLSLLLFGLFNEDSRAYWGGMLLVFLLKEDLAIIIFFVGIYQLVIRKKIKLGLITLLIAAGFFYLESTYLMPWFQDNPAVVKNHIDFYALGNNKGTMLITGITKPWIVFQTMVDAPEKIYTLIQTHLPFGFLPLFSPFYLLTALPIWLERLLSATQARWLFEQYYGISLTPFLVIATGQTLKALSKRVTFKIWQLPSIIWMTLVIFFLSLTVAVIKHAPITRLIHSTYYHISTVEASMNQAVSLIPPLSSVSAQQPFVSHLSGRSEIYWFPEHINEVKYVLVVNSRPATPLNDTERGAYITVLLKDKTKVLVYENNGVYLFRNSQKK